jgi:hypothetical protein
MLHAPKNSDPSHPKQLPHGFDAGAKNCTMI